MTVAIRFNTCRVHYRHLMQWSLTSLVLSLVCNSVYAQQTSVVIPQFPPATKSVTTSPPVTEMIVPTQVISNQTTKQVSSTPSPSNGITFITPSSPLIAIKPDLSKANTIKYEPPRVGVILAKNPLTKENDQRVHVYAPTEEEIKAREEFFKNAPRYTKSSEEPDDDEEEKEAPEEEETEEYPPEPNPS